MHSFKFIVYLSRQSSNPFQSLCTLKLETIPLPNYPAYVFKITPDSFHNTLTDPLPSLIFTQLIMARLESLVEVRVSLPTHLNYLVSLPTHFS